jgi:RNA polymerase sigma factor (sigma-70 family)
MDDVALNLLLVQAKSGRAARNELCGECRQIAVKVLKAKLMSAGMDVGNAEALAQDLAQKVAMKLFDPLERIADAAHFRAWTIVAAINTNTDHGRGETARGKKKTDSFDADDYDHLPAQDAGPERTAIAHEQFLRVCFCAFRLPEKEKRVFICRKILDLSGKETAEIAGMRESAVGKTLERATKAVIECVTSLESRAMAGKSASRVGLVVPEGDLK